MPSVAVAAVSVDLYLGHQTICSTHLRRARSIPSRVFDCWVQAD
jgi:hypothetical protein